MNARSFSVNTKKSKSNKDRTCWIVVEEGLTGTENQCVGVANILGIQTEIKRIKLKSPWSFISPYIQFHSDKPVKPDGILNPPYPDLVIAAGRKAIDAARLIKKESHGKTLCAFLQDPKIPARHFDLVAVAHHDPLRGPNVIVTDGAANKVTPSLLAQSKEEFADIFGPLPVPRIAVLIGGKSKTHDLTLHDAKRWCAHLSALPGSLMVTTSRRTHEDVRTYIEDTLKRDGNFIWDASGPNPYMGMLAWADAIFVTEDSVSMMCDAGTTGKPVYRMDMSGKSVRFKRFHDHMKSLGVVRDFEGTLDYWTYTPLSDAQKIAQAIEDRLNSLYE